MAHPPPTIGQPPPLNIAHVSPVEILSPLMTFRRKDFQIGLLLMLNFTILYIRPQEIFSPLAALRLPVLITSVCILCWLAASRRQWSTQMKVMFWFLVFEALRAFLGKLVFDDFVRNDFWQYHTWKDLFMQFVGLFFPMMAYLSSGAGLRLVYKTWAITTLALALYVATHHGVGPGGFLGDENDVGLALLMFLSLPLTFAFESRLPLAKKFAYFVISGAALFGIVSTSSRGAFVGLICVLTYLFIRSRRKILLLLALGFLSAAILPFLPKGYIEDMKTITDTDEGTAKIRKHYWRLAVRTWLDPKYFLLGVGMKNTAYHLGNYETPEELQEFPGSGGRAVHSVYFELLPDLGLWGILVVGYLLWSSFRGNRQILVLLQEATDKIESGDESIAATSDQLEGAAIIREEAEFLRTLSLAVNISFIAVFSAGAFVSILYYPMIWTLVTLSSMLQTYSMQVIEVADELIAHNNTLAQ